MNIQHRHKEDESDSNIKQKAQQTVKINDSLSEMVPSNQNNEDP